MVAVTDGCMDRWMDAWTNGLMIHLREFCELLSCVCSRKHFVFRPLLLTSNVQAERADILYL